MRVSIYGIGTAIFTSFVAAGCGPDGVVSDPTTDFDDRRNFHSSDRYSEWSAPDNLGPVINAPPNANPVLMADNSPELSKDGLSLYFGSVRPGGSGSTDLYVSQRSCTDLQNPDCAWGAPRNLGPTVNTSRIDGGPTLSQDGHLLYLISDRPGGSGSNDIYLSRRADKNDDLGWETPVNLGAPINSESLEAGPNPWGSEFYFHRGPVPISPNPQTADIYVSRMRGDAFGEPTIVEELSSPGFFTQRPSIRSNGREMFFSSNRPGSSESDIWTSTRLEGNRWTTPVNLGLIVNSDRQEQTPMISDDGTMLFFASNRTGNFDLYVSTRTRVPEG